MSKSSELHALRHSFSGDKQVKAQSRSGEKSESAATLWDFVAHTQSAEADIIEAEERAEQAAAKSEFAKLLRLYFKKILAAGEYKFLAACIRANKSLYAVGKSQGVKYKEVIESITAKCKQNEKEFFMLMAYTGYDSRRGCEFMSRLLNSNEQYKKLRQRRLEKREYNKNLMRLWRAANKERSKEINKKYNENNSDKVRAYQKKYKETHRDEQNAARRKAYYKNKELILERNAQYRKKHRDQIRAKDNEYKKTHRKQINAAAAEYRAKNKDKIKAYYEAHRDELNAKKRAKRAEERQKRLLEVQALEKAQ